MTNRTKPASTGRQPNPIDVHVGRQIRTRRKVRGVSQEALADALGLTFQQVQKYERGSNRVSASKLYEVARKLDVPMDYFFQGLDPTTELGAQAERVQREAEFLLTPEGVALSEIFPKIPARQRAQLLKLMQSMVSESDEES